MEAQPGLPFPPPVPGAVFVELRGAVLAYRRQIVLDGIDLALRAGETLALLGPNGAGKTSLMRLIAGRLPPASGTVRVLGADPYGDRRVRAAIGWVPQEIALYPRLSVAENLGVFAQLAGIGSGGRSEVVRSALALAAITDVAHRPVGLLSGGYQRRVNIAASLMAQPRVILLDEPTQGVDLQARAAIHAVLERLKAHGAAILVATHDFSEAERLCDRVAVLARGRILRNGSMADLLSRVRADAPEHEITLSAPTDPPAEAALRQAGFVPQEKDQHWRALHPSDDGLDGAALLAALRGAGVPVAEIRIRSPGLEAVYREALREGPGEVGPLDSRKAPETVTP